MTGGWLRSIRQKHKAGGQSLAAAAGRGAIPSRFGAEALPASARTRGPDVPAGRLPDVLDPGPEATGRRRILHGDSGAANSASGPWFPRG
jgi:hypothetical protein